LAVGRTLSIASPWLTLASGLVVLSCAFRKESPVNAGDHPALLALPFTMSLDNFAAGFGVSTLSGPVWLATFVIGVISAAMSCIGLYASCSVRRFLPRIVSAHAEGIVGTYLCILAVRMLCDAV
jgi:putative Mn2+ efflux pump MntP